MPSAVLQTTWVAAWVLEICLLFNSSLSSLTTRRHQLLTCHLHSYQTPRWGWSSPGTVSPPPGSRGRFHQGAAPPTGSGLWGRRSGPYSANKMSIDLRAFPDEVIGKSSHHVEHQHNINIKHNFCVCDGFSAVSELCCRPDWMWFFRNRAKHFISLFQNISSRKIL